MIVGVVVVWRNKDLHAYAAGRLQKKLDVLGRVIAREAVLDESVRLSLRSQKVVMQIGERERRDSQIQLHCGDFMIEHGCTPGVDEWWGIRSAVTV
jgi:hypothetical protein